PKALYIADNGEHAMSYTKNRNTYRKTVQEFLDKIKTPKS
ncbi:alpha/beta hydrolase, partial [Bacillus spizizenii]|nr:alpha/beta hydrolase [Bacillus spizizenii]